MTQTVCIIYGITEGPATGQQLQAALERAGFEIVHNPTEATIIFAHSGGCLLVPPKNNAKLIIMSGLPYWPGRPWAYATGIKIWREYRHYRLRHAMKQWFHKLAIHMRYMLNLRAALLMAANLSVDKPWNSRQHQVILRNRHDTYCSPDVLRLPFKGSRTFISLSGEHDDCWENPIPYVNLIQSLHE